MRLRAGADDAVEMERVDNTLKPAVPAVVNRDLVPAWLTRSMPPAITTRTLSPINRHGTE